MISRRNALLSTLFGASYVGLRALATGLPASLLLDPRRALADMPANACGSNTKAQFVIFNTSGNGDPINASVPGTYEDPKVVHSADPTMAPKSLTLAGQSFQAATPWTTLPQSVLDRTCFWHIMTNTPVHPKEPDVLKLQDVTLAGEMLPSILAKQLAPCLGTIQQQPISLGATSPSEGLTFGGQALPIIPALALKATLTSPAGPLTALQPLRDQTLNQLYDLYKNSATPAQQAYLDSLVTSQQQVRSIHQDLLNQLASIKDNTAASQVLAAVTLIQMNVSPVIAIHIPFGGDNHRDVGAGHRDCADRGGRRVDRVADGAARDRGPRRSGVADDPRRLRAHDWPGEHRRTPAQPESSGVARDRQAVPRRRVRRRGAARAATTAPCRSTRPAASTPSGDIKAVDTLAAFGQTMLAAVGVDPATIAMQITAGKVVSGALA